MRKNRVKMFISCVLLFSNLLTFNVLAAGATSLEEAKRDAMLKGFSEKVAEIYADGYMSYWKIHHDFTESESVGEIYAFGNELAITFLDLMRGGQSYDDAAPIAVAEASKITLKIEDMARRMVSEYGIDPVTARENAQTRMACIDAVKTKVSNIFRNGVPTEDALMGCLQDIRVGNYHNVLAAGATSLEEAKRGAMLKGFSEKVAEIYADGYMNYWKIHHDFTESESVGEIYAFGNLLAITFLDLMAEGQVYNAAAPRAIEMASEVILPAEAIAGRLMSEYSVDPVTARKNAQTHMACIDAVKTKVSNIFRNGVPTEDALMGCLQGIRVGNYH
ncbi:MAG: hypothetical protein LBR79_03725 [Oscillospiraceae bacterium]|jgi:hypothetical protein|nr:hypothetical protein [Oscillospiraceae bacterium]